MTPVEALFQNRQILAEGCHIAYHTSKRQEHKYRKENRKKEEKKNLKKWLNVCDI